MMTAHELTDVLKEARSLIGLAEPPGRMVSYSSKRWEERADQLIPEIDRAVGYLLDDLAGWEDTMRQVLSRLSAAERVVEAARTLRVELDSAATVVEQRVWDALDAYDGKSEPVTDSRD